jgi:hypothetical protein
MRLCLADFKYGLTISPYQPMANYIRYGALERAMGGGQRQISLDALSPTLERDAEGKLLPVRYEKIRLPANEVLKILKPYFSVRFMDQVRAATWLCFKSFFCATWWTIPGLLPVDYSR